MSIRPGLLVLCAAAAVGGLTSCSGATSRLSAPVHETRSAALPNPSSSSTSTSTSTAPPAAAPPTATPPPPEPPVTDVATLKVAAPASVVPGGRPVSRVPATWYGYPSVLPVIASAPGWVEVREAQRPNESTAWIPSADVTLSADPYYLVVSLATAHLQLFLHGYPVLDFPAGIGTPDDPTVTGNFFIAMKAAAPDPGYGPFVLVTSAHSDAITDWEGEGDAIIAIHGPIDAEADAQIGTTGARISHGCIRLHDSDLARLAAVPAGTPLAIVN